MSRYCEEAHRATRYKVGSKALRPGGCDDCGLNYCHCRIDPFETRRAGSALPDPTVFSLGDPVGKTGGNYRFDDENLDGSPRRRGVPIDTAPTLTQAESARDSGFSGNTCASCGSFAMVRTGTCETCQACGSTSGGCS